MLTKLMFWLLAIGLLSVSHCWAHPGRTDASGGHHDRKNGGYHYHGGGDVPSSNLFRSLAPSPRQYEVRTKPPDSRKTEARTRRSEQLGTDFDAPAVDDKVDRKVVEIEAVVDESKEEKARKLLEFARRQHQLGKVDSAVKYARRVCEIYERTKAATEAKQLLADWRGREPIRIWNSANGKFSAEAELVRLDRGFVYLRNRAGKETSVEIKRLSDADQQYVINREGL